MRMSKARRRLDAGHRNQDRRARARTLAFRRWARAEYEKFMIIFNAAPNARIRDYSGNGACIDKDYESPSDQRAHR